MTQQLRTDGLYVQIGTSVWNSSYFNTSDCWYNIIKVIDDDHAIVIGLSGFSTFFDSNREEIEHVLVCDNGNNYYRDLEKPFYRYCDKNKINKGYSVITKNNLWKCKTPLLFNSVFGLDSEDTTYQEIYNVANLKTEYTLRSFFNITSGITDCDILSVVKALSTCDWDNILTGIEYKDIYVCKLTKYKEKDELYDTENIFQLRDPYNPSDKKEQYIRRFDYCRVNDSFDAVVLNDDYSKIYAWHSPCMQETQPDNECSQRNNFPYYFIPFDLSLEDGWKDKYDEWKEKYTDLKAKFQQNSTL